MKNMKLKSVAIIFCLTLCFSIGTAFSQDRAEYRSAAYGKAYGYGAWKPLDSTYQVLDSYTFNLPFPLTVYVECAGYVYTHNSEARYGFNIDDNTAEDPSTRRFAGSSVANSNSFNTMHTARLFDLPKGQHTVYFLGMLEAAGAGGYANSNYFSISVLLFEAGNVTESIPLEELDDVDPATGK